MNEIILNEARKLISQRFSERRKELGFTQEYIAEITGLGIATIKRFESANFWIGTKQLLILCQAYQLFFFVEEKDSKSTVAKLMRERWKRNGDNN